MLELIQVEVDEPRLARLLQLYLHEWSALVATPIGGDARYAYDELPRYRDRATHAAFLFLDAASRAPTGFTLVMRDPTLRWHVEEFFIIAGARRRGCGAAAARRLFAERPGPWTFTIRPENPGALGFWRAAVPHAEAHVELGDDGIARHRLSFVAGPACSTR